jgi:hypothetical protein
MAPDVLSFDANTSAVPALEVLALMCAWNGRRASPARRSCSFLARRPTLRGSSG